MKEELAIRAAKLFTPKPWKHDIVFIENPVHYKCKQCKKTFPWHGNSVPGLLKKSCIVPTPIDINDWNVAMKLVKAAIKIVGYRKWIIVCRDHTKISRTPLDKATPADYIEAACIAKEKSNEAM